MSDHTGKLIRSTILYFPAQFLVPLVQFGTVIAWTYLLQPAGFGIVTFVISAQEFTSMLGVTWWTMFVLRFRLRYIRSGEDQFRRMDNLVACCAIAAQIALTLPMLWLAGASVDLVLFVSTAGFFISRTIFAHYCEWARADRLIGVFTAAQFIGSVGGSAMSIIALKVLGPSPSAALGAQAMGYGLGLIVLFNGAGLRFRVGRFDRPIFEEAKRYGGPLILSGVLGWVAVNCIRVIVQFSEGATGLGLLSVGWGLGQRIASVMAMLFSAASYPLAVSNLESGDRRGALSQVSLNGLFLLTILMPSAAGVAVLSSPLVSLMIAAQFREITIIVLPIALLAAAIRALRIHCSDQTMILLEHTHATMYANIFETTLNLVLCGVGLHLGGIVGAALGILAGTTAASLASFTYSFLRLDLPVPSAWTLLKILAATLAMCVCLWSLPKPETLPALAMTIAAGAATYSGMIIVSFSECRAMIGRVMVRWRRVKVAR